MSCLVDDFTVTVSLAWEARVYYHMPKVNTQTSGGKESPYFSILGCHKQSLTTAQIIRNMYVIRKVKQIFICLVIKSSSLFI